jgi:hypothetical protein
MVTHKIEGKQIGSEVVKKKCEVCGEITSGCNVCLRCRKLVCNKCARFSQGDRYCPICHEKIRTLYKLV